MIIRNDNMRTGGESSESQQTLDEVLRGFLRASGKSRQELAVVAPSVSNELRNRAEGILRRQGVPNAELDAEDVAQSWTAKMLDRGLDQYDPGRDFFRYGHAALRNGCSDVGRNIRRYKAVPLPASCAAKGDEPGEQVIHQEMRRRVRQAVAKLPKAMRRIVIAKYWLGMRSKQIANRLDIRVAAVDRLALLARRRLQKGLRM